MKIKDGVRVRGIRSEISFILPVIAKIFQDLEKDFVITSGTEGRHSAGSLHYSGAAIDIRTRHLSEAQKRAVSARIIGALTHEYDVVLERDHLHIEFQPKEA